MVNGIIYYETEGVIDHQFHNESINLVLHNIIGYILKYPFLSKFIMGL